MARRREDAGSVRGAAGSASGGTPAGVPAQAATAARRAAGDPDQAARKAVAATGAGRAVWLLMDMLQTTKKCQTEIRTRQPAGRGLPAGCD